MPDILLNALESGLPLAIGFLGVWLVLRTQNDFDLTVEASFTFGAAVSTRLLLAGANPWLTVLAAAVAGVVAGMITYVVKRTLGLTLVLASIIVGIGLYSLNLTVLGRANVTAPADVITTEWAALLGVEQDRTTDVLLFLVVALVVAGLLSYLLLTERGLALRASGIDPQMARINGVSTNSALLIALAAGNAMVAVSGALVAQQQGFADVNMGVGTLVFGVTAILLGETVVRKVRPVPLAVFGVVIGALVYRTIISYAFSLGVDPGLFQAITAGIVVAAIALNRGFTLARSAVVRKPLPERTSAGQGAVESRSAA